MGELEDFEKAIRKKSVAETVALVLLIAVKFVVATAVDFLMSGLLIAFIVTPFVWLSGVEDVRSVALFWVAFGGGLGAFAGTIFRIVKLAEAFRA